MKSDCNVHLHELYGLLESIFRVSSDLATNADKEDIDQVESRMEEHEKLLIAVREKMELIKKSYCQDDLDLKKDPQYVQLLDSIKENMFACIKKMEIRKGDAFQNIKKFQKRKSMIEYITR